MSALKLAVLRQVAYAHSVRGFIREILKALIPGKWIDRVIDSSDAAFDAKLDAAFATIDEFAATKEDYCRKVVNVLCDEIAGLCEALRESLYAPRIFAHLYPFRFIHQSFRHRPRPSLLYHSTTSHILNPKVTLSDPLQKAP